MTRSVLEAIRFVIDTHQVLRNESPANIELSLNELTWLAEELGVPDCIPMFVDDIPIVMVEHNQLDKLRYSKGSDAAFN